MAKQKHLTLEERFKIEDCLKQNLSFKKIGMELGKDCSTISKEVRSHAFSKKPVHLGILLMHVSIVFPVTPPTL